MKQYEFISICFLVWGELLQSTFFFWGGGKRGKPPTDFQGAFFFRIGARPAKVSPFYLAVPLGEFVGQT